MNSPADNQLDTPAMRQYRSFKEQYPGYVLFFRMGDFYETFHEDAKLVSRVLGLALTSRSKGASAVPLAGLPYHALDGYLARMIQAGHRVAICEQVEDPAQAKGLVKRDVVRLVTPGTLTEDNLLDRREGNFLACLFDPSNSAMTGSAAGGAASGGNSHQVGIAWAELSTGSFHTMLAPAANAVDELVRIHPAEVLVSDGSTLDSPAFRQSLRSCLGATLTTRPPWAFDAKAALDLLRDHFKTATLEGFGFDGYEPSLSAAAAIIDYLRETQKTALAHLGALRKFDRGDCLLLDANTIRSLEILRTLRTGQRAGTLLACVDATQTGMGARLLERWLTFPLRNYSDILARQDAVEELAADPARLLALREHLSNFSQIDRIAANIALCRVKPRELLGLKESLSRLPQMARLLDSCRGGLLGGLSDLAGKLAPTCELIARAIHPDAPPVLREGGVIADGFDPELDRLRRIGSDGQSWLAQYQADQVARTGISSLKVGYNKVFGYYLEVTHTHAQKVPADFVRKQTLKNAERYITDELRRYESEVLTAQDRSLALEAQLFETVRAELAQAVPLLQAAAAAVAALDVLAGFAHLANARHWRRPNITQEPLLHIVGGRHPVLEETLGQKFVPNDVHCDGDNRLLIITGPNMAGKSTYIRQTALLVLLAQTGSFIPAESATIGLADRIFARVGAADELAAGLSTFMVEMLEAANILNNATARSLVVLDELGRGTSTYDGLALAWAVSEHLALRLRCRALFATHYHELTELEELIDGVTNLNVAVREWADEVIFLHKIVEGSADRSYGVHVARLAGLPRDVLDRARQILPKLQAHLAEGLDVPALANKAHAAQMNLFADPASRVARAIKDLDLDNLTPLAALDLLRKFKTEL